MNIKDNLNRIHELQTDLTSSPYSHDISDLAMACVTSLPITNQYGMPLVWLLIAGVPSSDKTSTIKYLREVNNTFFLDSMTTNAFASGLKREKDADLLPKLDGKALIVKDLTTIFSMDPKTVAKLLGDMTSIYDEEFSKATGGEVPFIQYKSKFSFLGCVTHSCINEHRDYMSRIGSRFLFYRVPQLTDEEMFAGFELLRDTSRQQKQAELKQRIVSHVDALLNISEVDMQPEPQHISTAIDYLSILVVRGRAVPSWNKDGEVTSVQREEPFRAVQQLLSLGRALARVRGKNVVTHEEVEILYRVTTSTMSEDCSKVYCLFANGMQEVTIKDCQDILKKSKRQVERILKIMTHACLISKVKSSCFMLNPLIFKVKEHLSEIGSRYMKENISTTEDTTLPLPSFCHFNEEECYQQVTPEPVKNSFKMTRRQFIELCKAA